MTHSMTDLERHAGDPEAHQIGNFGGCNLRLVATGNVFGGDGAGTSLTTGDYNTAIGNDSLNGVTVADNNSAFGTNSLKVYNPLGALAGYASVFGAYAGFNTQSGDYITFIGAYAGWNAIDPGEGDIYIGSYAGSNVVTTGGGNIAIGGGAMGNADGTCIHNICIGLDAGESITDGDHNIYIGEDSGHNITVGEDNTFVGDQTGFNLTIGSSANTCLGHGAGPASAGAQSNTLWIDNHATDTPLIQGDFSGHTIHVNGTLSKTAGAFMIEHPLDSSKNLLHGFIEGPEYGLLYRGKAKLKDGEVTVDIDDACGMSLGVFEAIAANPTFYLQNMTSLAPIQGSLDGNILTLHSSEMSVDEVSWLICAERRDKYVVECDQTDDMGHLILEPERKQHGSNSTDAKCTE